MPDRTCVANRTPVSRTTLTEVFLGSVDRYGDGTAFQYFESEHVLRGISFGEALGMVRVVSSALEALGVTRGDRVAILSENRPEWALADYGCLCAGVIDVPIYATLPAPQVAYVLRDAGVKLVFTSTAEQMEKALHAAASCPQPMGVVVFDEPDGLPDGVMSWADFLEAGAAGAEALGEDEFRHRARQAGPEDVATILYTSGTTGDPKGVMLTHGNIGSNVEASSAVLKVTPDDTEASFLPLSHIFQRMVDYLFFHVGGTIAYPRSVATVVEDMEVIHPTVAVSVPRLYEKIYNGVMEARGLKKAVIDWAVDVADRARRGAAPRAYAQRYARAPVRAGGPGGVHPGARRGRREAALLRERGCAPGARVGALLLLHRAHDPGRLRAHRDQPGHEREYHRPPPPGHGRQDGARHGDLHRRGRRDPGSGTSGDEGVLQPSRETAEVIDGEGWFHTGDIGELDEDGYLRITDRKKDLIVTAGGKNVAPQPIENRLKSNAFIEQAVLVGDRRKFVSLLIVPSFTNLEVWAGENGMRWSDRAALLRDARVVRHMDAQVAAELSDLASFEKPKKIALLEDEFSIQNGLMTPTLKVKRRVIQDRFKDLIDDLYGDEARMPRCR